ncbi:hypothetical protein BKA64DRAFT_482082 [Cadophora sp. MPI-SDFR-AT-0126]|nr:hypothetical protein BKA64DRAFT_482082 [Leotiomycetes sp. MPI-SDFR-AT-0126]
MRPTFLGLSAVGWNVMIKSWWDKLLAGFLLATVVLGSFYVLYRIYCKVLSLWKGRHQQIVVPTAVARHLKHLRRNRKPTSERPDSTGEPKSFGVFLGKLANPPTSSQLRLLSKWDILVLDPLQDGVLDALSTDIISSTHIIGRLDVRTLANADAGSGDEHIIEVLNTIDRTLASLVGSQTQHALTGVLLAGYRTHLQPVVLNETAKYIQALGLELWLEIETCPSVCPTERECRETDMDLVRGLVYRNGTIRPDGDRQNYFQMAEMRQVMRAVAAQRSRTHTVLWETIDVGVEPQYAVVQRCFNWCRFSNSLCWYVLGKPTFFYY